MELVVKLGLHDTPTSKIAKAAGFSEATIYKNFSNKDELITEVYLDIKTNLDNAISSGINQNLNFEESTEMVLNNYLNFFINHPDELAYFSQFTNSIYMNKVIIDRGKSKFEFVNQYLADNIESGKIKDMPFAFYEAFINAPILEIARAYHMGKIKLSDDFRKLVVSNLLNIMKK